TQGRGLAAAAGTQQRKELAFVHLERDRADDDLRRIPLGQLADFEFDARRHPTPRYRSAVMAGSSRRCLRTTPIPFVRRAPLSAEPAIGHDQLDLLVLDRVSPHLAAVRIDAAVAIDTVERSSADPYHDQRFVARRLEPVERTVRQQYAFVLADRAGLVVRPVK